MLVVFDAEVAGGKKLSHSGRKGTFEVKAVKVLEVEAARMSMVKVWRLRKESVCSE